VIGAVLIIVASSIPTAAQLGSLFSEKKIRLRRMLPPAVELEAKSFAVEATSLDRAADVIASSFQAGFRAKIQSDDRFVYDAKNPSLRISITITRYYVEPKQLTNTGANNATCTTHTGSLQGTFSVIEVASRRPLASDTIGWSIQTGRTKSWLVSTDGREVNLKGPNEKMNLNDFMKVFDPDVASAPAAAGTSVTNRLKKLGRGGTGPQHPCDLPLTQNEARDILADAFMTDIIQMAMPYSLDIEVPLPSNKAIARAVEDAAAGEWTKALDGAIAAGELPKANDESERLYLIGLAYEALGYRDGQKAFDLNKGVRSQLPPDELTKVQSELKRVVDQTKESFDKSAGSFADANKKKLNENYRQGERRSDQSRRLYARIQKYRDMKAAPIEAPPPVRTTLRMSDIVEMCGQGSSSSVISFRIERAPQVEVSDAELGELSKCGAREEAIFGALKKRLITPGTPVPVANEAQDTKEPTPKAAAPKSPAAKPPAPKPAVGPARGAGK